MTTYTVWYRIDGLTPWDECIMVSGVSLDAAESIVQELTDVFKVSLAWYTED